VAAALLVVALAATTALWIDRRPAGGADSPAPDAAPAIPATLDAADGVDTALHDYVEAAELLTTAIDERRHRLSPETRAVLDKNLEIIDRAIAELREALERAPSDPANAQALQAMHEQKVELLRWVSRLAS
jgi:hypothetical protein